MNIIILGDKFQKRMKSKGCPGLIAIKNKPIIYHQYNRIKDVFPNANIIYIGGFEYKRLLSYLEKNNKIYQDIIVINNNNYDIYNYAYSLSLANAHLNDDCLLFFGEYIPSKILCQKIKNFTESHVFINKTIKSNVGCIIHEDHIENLAYDLDNYISHAYYINYSDAQIMKNLVTNKQYHNCFIFEIINNMISNGSNFLPFTTN